MTLVLHGTALSPYVRKCRVVLAEKGLAYDQDPIMPIGFSDDYKAMHPLAKIPLLTDGDRVVPDSSAICTYLEGIAPEPALYPADPYERARAIWWEEFGDQGIVTGAAAYFQENLLARAFFNREPDAERVEKAATEVLPPLFDYLERQLGDAEWLVGGRFTIADIAVGTQFVNYHHGGGEVDATRWPRTAAWVARTLARPSFKPLIEEELAQIQAMQ